MPLPNVPAILLLIGCLMIGACSTNRSAPASPAGGHRTIAEGYSLLYAIASQQKDVSKLLVIKPESDAVDALINELATYMGELSAELEDFAKRYPAITVDTEFLPEVEARARESIKDETTKGLLGKSGRDFERYLLLKQWSALDAEYHIAKVMVEMETSEERRAFWVRTEKRLGDLRAKVDRLLARDYYK